MAQNESVDAAGHATFDKIAGKAKEVVGGLIADETLVEEGELQQQKAETAKDAARLAVEADQRQAEADLKSQQTENQIEQQRVSAELAERQREQQLERDRQAAEQSVEQQAAQQEAELNQRHSVEERILDVNEAEVAVDLVDDASVAAELELEAQRSEAAADALSAAQRNLEQR